MTDEELTFDAWSSIWDRLFVICEMRNDSRNCFKALLAHTFRYKPRWNRGLP